MAGPDDPAQKVPAAAAAGVWERLGNTVNFVEPFGLGLFTVLLTRPASHRRWERFESVNDPRGGISSLLRALAADPNGTAAAFADADLEPPALPTRWTTGSAPTPTGTTPPRRADGPAPSPGRSAPPAPLPSTTPARLRALANRLRRVRVASGKWQRLVGRPAKTAGRHITAVLMDPPPAAADHDPDDRQQALAWVLEHGSDPRYRIAHAAQPDEEPALRATGWDRHGRFWFSPRCAPAGSPEDPEHVAARPSPARPRNQVKATLDNTVGRGSLLLEKRFSVVFGPSFTCGGGSLCRSRRVGGGRRRACF